ncbi:protein kinase [candidate division CSSED10-310 bacterium]|uniref:Protein kinase n=1 Tax=candidate division CSSED10-310 bacterium TaxID=2855610 RepID=A0ABV6Z5Q4_UNCC1
MPVIVGSILGNRFDILEEIGTGGMGIVFKAKDKVLDEIVALKVLKADLATDSEMISRFKREIKVARKIKHKNVCSIYDFGMVDDIFFISMEFLAGVELSQFIDDGALSLEQIWLIIEGIIAALSAAHAINIIHRDLKPSNIMIDQDYRSIITDFGLAKYVGSSDLTQHDKILGTPVYMSPEQIRGGIVDHRSDIYSLGILLYEIFTGIPPFVDGTPIMIAMQHLNDIPARPHEINENIPEEVEKTILKCLEKDPQKRYQHVAEILHDLKIKKEEVQAEKNLKVLIADDDESIRSLLSIILQKNGFEPVLAQNGEEAIEKAIAELPALICLDVMMPRMDGYQAAEFLKDNQTTAHIPIIMITVKTEKEYKAYSKSIGIKEHITKPVDINKLIKKIKKYLS